MIVDAHCHAWEVWPYQPAVPDALSRARAERLLWEMDQAGVAKAVLIAAAIDGNPENNAYTATCAGLSKGRLLAFPAVDCRWDATHHSAGAEQRLRAVAQRFDPAGFTHYLHEDGDPSWLLSNDGLAFFGAAQALGLILSLACGPAQLPTVCTLASRFPAMPILVHHLGRVMAEPFDNWALKLLLDAAKSPNIFVKLSGFGYAVADGWNFPNRSTRPLVKALYEHYGAGRLCWGSDYPVSQRYMTYRQSLEVLRSHCAFIPEADMQQILGATMLSLLARHSSSDRPKP